MPKLYRQGDEGRLDLQDVRAITRWMPAMGLLKRYFKYTEHGLENLPQDGPALVAMNHGPMPVDAPLLGVAIYEATGRLPRGPGRRPRKPGRLPREPSPGLRTPNLC